MARIKFKMKIEDIPIVNKYKWLGITLDKKLSANYHIEEITKKIKKYLKLITILKFKKYPLIARIQLFKTLCIS